MTRMKSLFNMLAVFVVLLACSTLAQAQATRTWVSGVGDDANPCSRTAPCKTFAGAISKTAAGGEINALDPGGFGGVTITKAITIDGGGVLAGVLVSGTNAIVVNAGATDRVVLRNLTIDGLGTGLSGIQFQAGKSLHVEDCTIFGFTTAGINVVGAGDVFVNHTTVRNISGTLPAAGIALAPPTGIVRAFLDGVRVETSAVGVSVGDNVVATVRGTSATGNDAAGFSARGSAAELNLSDIVASNNQTGVQASGGARVRMTGATVTDNSVGGLLADNGAEILTFTENQVAGNPPGGATVCELSAGTSVGCPAEATSCPTPVCESPTLTAGVGPCKRCRTKNGVTTCSGCAVDVH